MNDYFSNPRRAWALALIMGAATAGCTSQVSGGSGGGSTGTGGNGAKVEVGQVGVGGSWQVTVGTSQVGTGGGVGGWGGPSTVGATSTVAGTGGVGGTTVSTGGVGGTTVSTGGGVGGADASCEVPPVIGPFTFCGGTASVSTGAGMDDCNSITNFCDKNGNNWEVYCQGNGTCTCSFNGQPYCECSTSPAPPQCGGFAGYGCCPILLNP